MTDIYIGESGRRQANKGCIILILAIILIALLIGYFIRKKLPNETTTEPQKNELSHMTHKSLFY